MIALLDKQAVAHGCCFASLSLEPQYAVPVGWGDAVVSCDLQGEDVLRTVAGGHRAEQAIRFFPLAFEKSCHGGVVVGEVAVGEFREFRFAG
jgi:hypothetical protein